MSNANFYRNAVLILSFIIGWPQLYPTVSKAQVSEAPGVAQGEAPLIKRQYYAAKGPAADVIAFDPSTLNLKGDDLFNPTSLQFGPDGRLYVAQQLGTIAVYTITKNGRQDYVVTDTEKITIINLNTANHDDDGALNTDLYDTGMGWSIDMAATRQITGIYVAGTAENPVIYATSSDPRHGAGESEDIVNDIGLDTNSGVVHRITWENGTWNKIDLVRGLPRSEENHSLNGLQYDEDNHLLYVAVGGLTNAGSPSDNYAHITEYALSAAIIEIDLNVIDQMPIKGSGDALYVYDMPTLDDPTRPNANGIDDPQADGYDGIDVNDPFGGNNGLNQAKLVPGGPVQLHATGLRNAYDLLIMKSPGYAGKMYTIDNGANAGWGGHPVGEGAYPSESQGLCTNAYDPDEPGSIGPGPNDSRVNNLSGMHYVRELEAGKPYYAGHPNPVRGNPAGSGLYTYFDGAGVFRDSKTGANPLPTDWPPVPVELTYAAECDFRNSGVDDGSLIDYMPSTNGMAEYTASNFQGALQGAIISAAFDGSIFIAFLNEDGDEVTNEVEVLFSNFGGLPLDVTTQGDSDVFPGTIWAATFGSGAITVFEPAACADGPDYDFDNDGYTNEDELANGTDECNASETPADADSDFVSDLNDQDDDNDGIADIKDAFAIDTKNGSDLSIPFVYDLFNDFPGEGFFGLGFTGLMINGTTDYLDLFDSNMIFGPTSGLFTIPEVPEGDALEAQNDQHSAFQFGLNVDNTTAPFVVDVRMQGPFFNGVSPVDGQSQGFYIGTGDQDNYLKVALAANGGHGGLEVVLENEGSATRTLYSDNLVGDQQIPDDVLAAEVMLSLLLKVDPQAGTAQPGYIIDNGETVFFGTPVALSGDVLNVVQAPDNAMAIGIIATSKGPGPEVVATWDKIETYLFVEEEEPPIGETVALINVGGPAVTINGVEWEADTYYTGGGLFSNPGIDIANTELDLLYQTERLDSEQEGFTYNIPVPSIGTYTVVLHMAEIYFGAPGEGEEFGAPGQRIFNIDVENGQAVLTDIDMYEQAGAATALVNTVENISVTDATLDITLTSSIREGKLSAIEVYANDLQQILMSTSVVNFYAAEVGGASWPRNIEIANTGTETRSVTNIEIIGPDADEFSLSFTDAFDILPDSSETFEVVFEPGTEGAKTALLEVTFEGVALPSTINLQGEGQAIQRDLILFRVNAGGPALASLDGQRVWSEDQARLDSNAAGYIQTGTPSPYANIDLSGDYTFGTLDDITFDASVPLDTPEDLFKTERWDPVSDANLVYSFDVIEGRKVDVHIFLAELFLDESSNESDGPRVFDIAIDGTVPAVFDDIDIYADYGQDIGVMLTHRVISDGSVDIELISEGTKIGPAIKGIEIADVVFIDSEETDSALPTSFVVNGNYPNPFNPSTTIYFDLPDAAEVGVEVYDVMGRKALDVSPSVMHAGQNRQVVVDASGLASGVYFYRVVANFASRKEVGGGRMTFLK